MPPHHHVLVYAATLLQLLAATHAAVGLNYGTMGDNLPPPAQVAEFLRTKTIVNTIKLWDANPDILRAFANTSIAVTISVANNIISTMAQLGGAQQWVAANVAPFVPATRIIRVLVGNEVLRRGPTNAIDTLVPAMRSLRQALDIANFRNIQVSTTHRMHMVLASGPPSTGMFWPKWETVLTQTLQFHRETKSPFMINPYPYLSSDPENLEFCIFESQPRIMDSATGLGYDNMYDALIDLTLFSMKALGYGDVEIAVGETGWPTVAEGMPWVNPKTAQIYNGNLIRRDMASLGTPMMPGRRFEVYMSSLFSENLKPGPLAHRNFGLFRPDFTPVYDSGLLRTSVQAQQWCLAKPGIPNPLLLQGTINNICSQGFDCRPIQPGGACFEPNDQLHHASFVMNAWYQAKGHLHINCEFAGTAHVVSVDPSYGTCRYPGAAGENTTHPGKSRGRRSHVPIVIPGGKTPSKPNKPPRRRRGRHG